jgi:hypothetical protein
VGAAAGKEALDDAVVAALETNGLRGAGLVGVVADGSAAASEKEKAAQQNNDQ